MNELLSRNLHQRLSYFFLKLVIFQVENERWSRRIMKSAHRKQSFVEKKELKIQFHLLFLSSASLVFLSNCYRLTNNGVLLFKLPLGSRYFYNQ